MVKTIITRYELRKHMNEEHEGTKQASAASTDTGGQLEGKRGQQKLENKSIPLSKQESLKKIAIALRETGPTVFKT